MSPLHPPVQRDLVLAAEPVAALDEDGFAAVLRERTKAVHREAERTGFIADLLRGRATQAGYIFFLRNLAPVYEALEHHLVAGRHDPLLAPFAAAGVRRHPRLVADIAALAERDDPDDRNRLPESAAYVSAIHAAALGGAARLAAHAYARYLGDLSGGQIMRPLLARHLGLAAEELQFYAFPDLSDVEVVKADMRRALDAVPTNSAVADTIIEEAIGAFRHNIALSLAISGGA